MARVVIDAQRCKGCGLCVEICPRKILIASPTINQKGVHPIVPSDPDACTGCLLCTVVCPDVAITIWEPEAPSAE